MKINKTIIITTLLVFLLLQVVLADRWVQYLGSPTSSSIQKIRVYGDTAMAVDSSYRVLNYNGSVWQEIVKPTDIPTGTLQGVDFDKAEDNVFYWMFANKTNIKTYSFNPVSKTWSSAIDSFTFTTSNALVYFGCINRQDDGGGYSIGDTNECWIHRLAGNSTLYGAISTANINSIPNTVNPFYVYRNVYTAGGCNLYNGVSWSGTIGGCSGTFVEYNSLYRWVSYANNGLRIYNQTSGTYQSKSYPAGGFYYAGTTLFLSPQDLGVWGESYVDNTYLGESGTYWGTTVSEDTYKGSARLTAGYIDEDTLTGWAGMNNGNLYKYENYVAPVINPNFNVVTTPNSNPTLFQSAVIFTTVVNTNYAEFGPVPPTNATVRIYNNTGGILASWNFIPTGVLGYSGSKTLNLSDWLYLRTGQTYYVNTTITDGTHNAVNSFTWSVIGNATINTTVRNITGYGSNDDYTQIFSITKINNNRIYGAGNDLYGHYILSYDITNPQSIVTKYKIINESSTAFDEPTSISLNNATLYLGTNNRLFAFSNADYADASQVIQDLNAYSFPASLAQRINDLESTNTGVYMCHQGAIYDELSFYTRATNNTATFAIADPCEGVILKNDRIFVRLDDGIRIFNATTAGLITTISGLASPYAGARHDLMSISGNNLYFSAGGVGSSAFVYRYNITTNTATLISKCYNQDPIISLEALYDDIVVTGGESGGGIYGAYSLRICDFSDSSLYDVNTNTYSSINLAPLATNEIPYELIKMTDTGKFAGALNSKIGVFFYTRTNVEIPTNNPPTISSITPSDTTPCTNQTITVTIEASDPDTASGDLRYDYDCVGTKTTMTNTYATNLFSCTYTQNGTYTIKAFVKDPTTSVSNTRTVTVSNCNASLQNYLNFRILDSTNSATLEGVLVNVVGQTSGTTNSAGTVSFQLPNSGTYTVTFSKGDNYATKTLTYQTMNGQYLVYLVPTIITGGTTNILTVNTVDENDNPLPYVGVSVTDPVTAISRIGQTDAVGTTLFTNLPIGLELKITASKTGYRAENAGIYNVGNVEKEESLYLSYFTIQNGETKTLIIKLLNKATNPLVNYSSGRGCSDGISGIILCSPLNVSGDGDNCDSDDDCIGGRCQISPSNSRTCSTFNWTYCDDIGMSRGNSCFIRATTGGMLGEAGSTMIKNFFYVLVAIAILFFIIIIVRSFKKQ